MAPTSFSAALEMTTIFEVSRLEKTAPFILSSLVPYLLTIPLHQQTSLVSYPMRQRSEDLSFWMLQFQVVKPVQWHQSMQHMIEAGVTEFTEPGPGRVLAGLLRKIDRDKSARNIEAVAEL